ncbi:hypothetical protein ACSSS7_002665 [Eimeria intestinalis]
MAKKKKGKGKKLTGSPEVLRFKGTVPFCILEALAEASPDIRMQLNAFLSQHQQQQQQQQHEQQQQKEEVTLQRQPSHQQQEADLDQLRFFLHLLGRLADELKASKPKDYRFLWAPELLQPEPQYNPTGYPLSTLLHARSLAAAAAAGAAAAAPAASDAVPGEELTILEGTLGSGAGETEPAAAAAAALREQKHPTADSAAEAAAAAAAGGGGGGDPHSVASQQDPDSSSSSSSSSCCCWTSIDGISLSLPLQTGEMCASFLEAFSITSEAALGLAASGVSTNFSGGLVGFLSSLKETLKEIDAIWRAAEEELIKAMFAAINQQQSQLKALLDAEAQVSQCEAEEVGDPQTVSSGCPLVLSSFLLVSLHLLLCLSLSL